MSDLFKQYPNLTEYFKTSDGETFYKEEPAKTHARSLENKKVERVERPSETLESKTETAKDIIAKAALMDLETAKDYLAKEEELEQPRKTVTDALQKRIDELETTK